MASARRISKESRCEEALSVLCEPYSVLTTDFKFFRREKMKVVGVVQVVECLPSNYKALSSNTGPQKKRGENE
jgi:hypothetical protein